FAGAGTNGAGTWRSEVRAPHLVLQRRAVERTSAGAALIEHDDAVLAPLGRERAGDVAIEDRQPGLTRATREHEQHAVRRVRVVAHSHLQMERPPRRVRAVERNIERRARVAGDPGARMGAVEPGAPGGRGYGNRKDGED